jgi:hypothetical protein
MTKRKYQKPMALDLPYKEATERFAQVDPSEMRQAASGTADLTLRGVKIREHEGNVCLNDLWALAGQPENIRPANWRRQKGTGEFLGALITKLVVSGKHNNRKSAEESIYYILGGGRAKATYAHPTMALEYARHLSPDLAVEVNDLFVRFKADAVGLALEILDEFAEQVEYDAMRVELRELVAKHNTQSAGAAQRAGVRNFENYNGAGLRGLYGGLTKANVVERKGLPEGAHHLDYAGHEELAANYFKATQATAKLKRETIKGQQAAESAHEEVGEAVRKTIEGLGGTMPEDEPALDHIREAKKRLKAAEPKALGRNDASRKE